MGSGDQGDRSQPRLVSRPALPELEDILTTIVPMHLAVPAVEASSTFGIPRLTWSPTPSGETVPGPDLLPAFAKLAHTPAEDILAFARRWGVLGICPHGLVAIHPGCSPLGFVALAAVAPPEERFAIVTQGAAERDVNPYWEPLSAWRHYAGRMRAMLQIAVDSAGRLTPRDDDAFIALSRPQPLNADWSETIAYDAKESWQGAFQRLRRHPDGKAKLAGLAWRITEASFNDLLALIPLRARLSIGADGEKGISLAAREGITSASSSETPYLRPDRSLFTALVVQLALALIGRDELVRCSWCETPFLPAGGRRPRRDRRRFCTAACRMEAKRETNRHAARRRYARRHERSGDRPGR
ncbi:MAG: hypothetical protein ACR2LS_03685 [Thermomicrobiales bacterium]